MSNSAFQQTFLSYVSESTAGTTPGTPSMLKLRTNDPLSMSTDKNLLESEEVLSHRQEEHTRHGMKLVSGSVPTELSYGAYNDWLEALTGGSWDTGTLKAGTNVNTFTVEQYIGTSMYRQGLGVTPTQLTLSIQPNSLVTANWDLVGMDWASASSTLGSASAVATNDPFDGLSNASINEGGSSIATVTSIELTINANKNVGGLLGTDAGDEPTNGLLQITGTVTARFNSLTLFQKFENETESSLDFTLTNPGESDTLKFELPRIKYTGGQPQNNDNVVDGSFGFRALYNSSDSSSIIITEA